MHKCVTGQVELHRMPKGTRCERQERNDFLMQRDLEESRL